MWPGRRGKLRLVVEEAVGDGVVQVQRRPEHLADQRGRPLGLRAAGLEGTRPVHAPQGVADALHRREGSPGEGRRVARATLPQQVGAAHRAVQDAAGRLRVLEQELEHGQPRGSHLEDATVGIARAEQTQKGRKLDLLFLRGPAVLGEGARAGERGVRGDDGAFQLLADPAEAPAVVI